jgi:hypothetical protein
VATTEPSVSAAVETLQVAIGEDPTAALCALQGVRIAFAAALDQLTLRAGHIEAGIRDLERSAPILFPFDEPIQAGRGIKRNWVRIFWVSLILLSLSALAGGFISGRMWGRQLPFRIPF